MDYRKLIFGRRENILDSCGIDVSYEQSNLSDYKYTIKNNNFSVYVYRDNRDEVDTLFQILTYLESTPHKVALAEANAYADSIGICDTFSLFDSSQWKAVQANHRMYNKLRNARKIDLEKELEDLGIENINSFHCTNVIGLEKSKQQLSFLYEQFNANKKIANELGLDYESAIFEAKTGLEPV